MRFCCGGAFHISQALVQHNVIGPGTHLKDILHHPLVELVELLGIFSAFKLYWVVFAAVIYACAKTQHFNLLLALCALIFSFVPVLLIAWDVTRITNFSFMGVLLMFPVIYKENSKLFIGIRKYMPVLAALSFIIPTYNICLFSMYDLKADANGRIDAFQKWGIYHIIAENLPITLPKIESRTIK